MGRTSENEEAQKLIETCLSRLDEQVGRSDGDNWEENRAVMVSAIEQCKLSLYGSVGHQAIEMLNDLRYKVCTLHWTKWKLLLGIEMQRVRERTMEILDS